MAKSIYNFPSLAPLLEIKPEERLDYQSIPPPQQASQERSLDVIDHRGTFDNTDQILILTVSLLFGALLILSAIIIYRRYKSATSDLRELKKEKSKSFLSNKFFGLVRRLKSVNVLIGIAIILLLLNLAATDEQRVDAGRELSYVFRNVVGEFFYETRYIDQFDCLVEGTTRAVYQVSRMYENKEIFGVKISKKQISARDFFGEESERKLLERYDWNPNCKYLKTEGDGEGWVYGESLKAPVKL